MSTTNESAVIDPAAGAHASARSPLMNRLAVLAVAAGTFTVVTTEMLPVGLLTAISAELGVSAGTAGLTMTAPGIVAAAAAPALTVATGRLDRRLVLMALVALLAAANLGAAFAPNFPVLLLARVLTGVAIGGVWAIAAGLAVRLVPERSVGTATSMVFSGIAVASVVGVPVGTLIGDLADWRTAFTVMAVLSAGVLVALAVLLPALPGTRAIRWGQVPGLFRDARLRTGLAVTLLLVTGHFAAYTYIRPVLEQVPGVGAGAIGTLLLVYGVAGVAGNFAAGAAASRRLGPTVLAIAALVAASVLLVPVAGGTLGAVVALLAVWGAAYGGVSVSMQTWLLTSSPQAPEAGSALFVATFNIAISLGALSGGRAVDAFAPSGTMWFGGALAVLAAAAVLIGRSPRRR
ncbi:putative MFS family arabinose efflux permease [Murinocardiopsis flavida]|uniref:Putative MFS family arabinose efflux permease n=1 Tax=Murinocardiopsis flavida TaxID=645275 RepID=A0A2P8DML7_9ACTN|nr:MFS transporter [Murinocardiopsis flavida]PSK98463.1 putative MFS family arabinose efflux permease [Murinocardiopsis flavida]